MRNNLATPVQNFVRKLTVKFLSWKLHFPSTAILCNSSSQHCTP